MYKNGIVQNQHTFSYYNIVFEKANDKKNGHEMLHSRPFFPILPNRPSSRLHPPKAFLQGLP